MIVRIPPSSWSSSNSYLSVSNGNNSLNNVDNETYATVTHSRSNNSGYAFKLKDFDFSLVPDYAIVNSFSVKIRLETVGLNTSNSNLYISKDSSPYTINSDVSLPTSNTIITFSTSSVTWESIKNSSRFEIAVYCQRSNKSLTGYAMVYGAEIYVDYSADFDAMYFKNNGSWVSVAEAYKKENGVWVQKNDWADAIDMSKNYVRGN